MYLNDLPISQEELRRQLLQKGVISVPLIKERFLSGMLQETRFALFDKLPAVVGKHNTRQSMEAWHVQNRQSRFWLLAEELTNFFANQLIAQQFKTDLSFNEVKVLRYPNRSIGIEPHRDSAKYVNLICLCNLTGGGKFITCSDRIGNDPAVYRCEPGDVVIMRGHGFCGNDGRPFHYVPPVTARRLVCSIRQKVEI